MNLRTSVGSQKKSEKSGKAVDKKNRQTNNYFRPTVAQFQIKCTPEVSERVRAWAFSDRPLTRRGGSGSQCPGPSFFVALYASVGPPMSTLDDKVRLVLQVQVCPALFVRGQCNFGFLEIEHSGFVI